VLTSSHGGTIAEKTVEPAQPDTLAGTPLSPEALIEEARQRQRRRRLWVAVVVLAVVSGVIIGVLASGGSGSVGSRAGASRGEGGRSQGGTGTNTSVRAAVDLAATPKGWVPFAFQDAQVSVPATWMIEPEDCGTNNPKQGVVFLGGCFISPNPCLGRCPSNTRPDDWIELSALPYPLAWYRGHGSYPVNGYRVYEYAPPCAYQCLSVYDVPSLGVELTGGGPTFPKVLHTLSSSPRSVVIEPGPAPSIPSSWQRVSFGGLSIAVPKSWPIEHASFYNNCWFLNDLSDTPSVVLNEGTNGNDEYSASCENQQDVPTTTVIAAPNGILIDPGGYRREGTTGSCNNINGLSVCVVTSDPYGQLTLSLQVPGRVYPMAVEIGLVGSGEVARTILYSMVKA
jgi:hypothetical protein